MDMPLHAGAAGMLEPPFVPALAGAGDASHFGRGLASSSFDATAELLPALLAGSTSSAFREF